MKMKWFLENCEFYFSTTIHYTPNTQPECGQPPVNHFENMNFERNVSPPPDYESLSRQVTDTFKAKQDIRPKTASSLKISVI